MKAASHMNSVTSWERVGNKHLNLEMGDRSWPHHRVVAKLALKHSREGSRILDIGCGLGHTVAFIQEGGGRRIFLAEAYQACLDKTMQRVTSDGNYLVDEKTFNVCEKIPPGFDVVIMSHVLEHLLNPVTALTDALSLVSSGGVLILVVPNVARPGVTLTGIVRRHYVNRGHVFAWDMSHWKNFLENIMQLTVVEYGHDYVRIGRYQWKAFEQLGIFAGKLLPWWCFSNIAVVRKP